MIPPPLSDESGKREKEEASAAVAVSTSPCDIHTFLSWEKRLASLFLPKYHQIVTYL